MSRTIPWVFALCLLLAGPTLLGPIAGLEGPSNTASAQAQPAWSVSLSVDRDSGFAFTSVHAQGPEPARVSGSFDLSDRKLTIRYASPPPGQAEDVRPRVVNTTLTLASIYEFRDVNGNDRFDLGDDVVHVAPIEADRRARIDRIDGPGLIEGARAVYSLDQLGQLTFELRTSSRPEPLGYRTVMPPDPILDITLEDPDPLAGDTEIAVLVRLGGAAITHTAPRTLTVDGQGALALYDWRSNATVDGQDVDVGETILRQRIDDSDGAREEALIVLSTPQGERIRHASSIGFEHERTLEESLIAQVKGNLAVFLFGLSITTLLVGAAAIQKLRPDSKDHSSS